MSDVDLSDVTPEEVERARAIVRNAGEMALKSEEGEWPRQISNGRWVTSDRYAFEESQYERAKARQDALDSPEGGEGQLPPVHEH